MSDAIIVGIISVAGSVVVQLIVSYSKYRETSASIAATEVYGSVVFATNS